jgi:Flp pilus assembly protein TadG
MTLHIDKGEPMKKNALRESGQALVLVVLVAVGLIGITGLTIDGGAIYSERRQAQNAADSAALAAALAHVRGEDWTTKACEYAASNGYDNNSTTNSVQVHHPPISGPYAGDNSYFQVVISTKTKTLFGSLLGINEVNSTVEAVTRASPSSAKSPYFGEAIVALKPDGRGAFRSHGNNEIEVLGGGVFVNSSDTWAFEQMGNSVMDVPTGIGIVGGYKLQGAITPATGIATGSASIPYPPKSLPPEPLCVDSAGNDLYAQVDGNTMTPGNWSGRFPPNGVTHLQSGIYCIDGMFMLNGHDELTAHEVLFYMRSGNIHWNGNSVQVDLTPPSSGPFEGLLVYIPMDNDEGIIFNGNAESTISGTVFAPASDIQINGTGSTQSYHSQFIGYTIDLIGDAAATINYETENKFFFPPPVGIQLTQ